jgi:hypothetical protein
MRAAVAALCWSLTALSASAQPHSHNLYDPACCTPASQGSGSGDCYPIPNTAVRFVQGKVIVTLNPGDHPMVTRPHTFEVEWNATFGSGKQSTIRPSKDGQFHACLYLAPGGS